MITIYALVDPRNEEVRYVGQARNVQRRYAQHCDTNTGGGVLKRLWVRRLISLGLRPRLLVLERVNGQALRDATRHEAKWIAHYRAMDHDVLNGPGGVYTTPALQDARAQTLYTEEVRPGMLVGEHIPSAFFGAMSPPTPPAGRR